MNVIRVAGRLIIPAVLGLLPMAATAVHAACSCQGAIFLSKLSQSQIVRVCRNADNSHTEEVVVNAVKAGPLAFGPDRALYAAVASSGDKFDSIVRYDPNTGAVLGTFVFAGTSPLTNAVSMDFGPDALYVLDDDTPANCPDGNSGSCASVVSYNLQGGHQFSMLVSQRAGRLRYGPHGRLYITEGFIDSLIDPLAPRSFWALKAYPASGTGNVINCVDRGAFGQTGHSGFCTRDDVTQDYLFKCNPFAIEVADPMSLWVGDDCGIVHLVSVAPDGTCAAQALELNNFQNCGGIFCAGLLVTRSYPLDLRRGTHPPLEGDFLHALNIRPKSQSSVDCTTNKFVGADVLSLATADLRHATADEVHHESMAVQPASPCEDNDPCTDEVCGLNGCEHIPRNCDDGNPCTDDSCNQNAAGCVHVPTVCQPSDQCHDAGTCTLPNGCSNPVKANGAACNDGNGCTVNDACVAGACGGDPAPAACDPTASAGSLVGGSAKQCSGGTVDANDNCVIQAGGVTLEIPLGGPPFAVNPPQNISIVNHTPGSPCPFFSIAAPSGRQLSCTEFLPPDFAFGAGKTGKITFGWLNTGRGGQPACTVDTAKGTVFEGSLGIFRDGAPLVGRAGGLFTAPSPNACDPRNSCPTDVITRQCNDQTLCVSQTCDPVANTLTLVDKHFSEYAIGLPCGEIVKPRLRIARLGEQRAGRFSFSGSLPDASSDINPVADGFSLTLIEPTGASFDVLIPGGALWRADRSARRWSYVNHELDAPSGIYKAIVDRTWGTIRFRIKGRRHTYDATTAVRAAITLGSGGQCFEADFTGPSPTCALVGSGTMLNCR